MNIPKVPNLTLSKPLLYSHLFLDLLSALLVQAPLEIQDLPNTENKVFVSRQVSWSISTGMGYNRYTHSLSWRSFLAWLSLLSTLSSTPLGSNSALFSSLSL